MDEIKAYWYRLKTEYENRYKEEFLKDFEKSKTYLETMENYLLERLEDNPSDVDVVCTLASVRLELRDSESDCVNLLKNFLDRFGLILDNTHKARIYTNIGFYEDYSKEALEFLTKAYELKSPYIETYTGLGLYYFSEFQGCKLSKDDFFNTQKNISLSKKYFEIAKDMNKSYKSAFNYAVCLFELKEYEQAEAIFLDLLKKYPNRMRLMLAISYCEAYRGNKEKSIYYLKQVKDGQDDNYSLNTDDIADYEIFNVYYVLEEYDEYLAFFDKVISDYYTVDWEHYYYVLWLKNEKEKFYKLEEHNRTYLDQGIKDAIADDDYDSEEEKQEIISDCEKDKTEYEDMISRIKKGESKLDLRLELYPEFSCFLIDCVRHQF